MASTLARKVNRLDNQMGFTSMPSGYSMTVNLLNRRSALTMVIAFIKGDEEQFQGRGEGRSSTGRLDILECEDKKINKNKIKIQLRHF